MGDVDWVEFSLSAGSEVVIVASGPSGDARMWLYDVSLSELEYDVNGVSGLYPRIGRLCGTDALTKATYRVTIDESGNDEATLSYEFTFTSVGRRAGALLRSLPVIQMDQFQLRGPRPVPCSLTARRTVGPLCEQGTPTAGHAGLQRMLH
ncbi:hypothetical protein ACFLT5_03125 [Chloroflexota bacterium]